MNRQSRKFWSLVLIASVLASGCAPQQPFYCREDGDLSHYLGVATEIEYPDTEESPSCEVTNTLPPLTLKNTDNYQDLGSDAQRSGADHLMPQPGHAPARWPNCFDCARYDLAHDHQPRGRYHDLRSGLGRNDDRPLGRRRFTGNGTEAALSEFDAQLDASVFWEKNRRPQNRAVAVGAFRRRFCSRTLAQFTSGITKTTAEGTTMGDPQQHNVQKATTFLAISGRRPNPAKHSRASGTQISKRRSRIRCCKAAVLNTTASRVRLTFEQYAAGFAIPVDGVMIARIRTDQTLNDFEGGVRNLMHDVEDAYWELYFAYRDLEARKMGRDSALETWKKTAALYRTGSKGGSADREAEARSQYFLFRSQVEQALTDVFKDENRLRYIMGLSMSDGRLIRPSRRADDCPRGVRLVWHPLRGAHAPRGNPPREMGNQAS